MPVIELNPFFSRIEGFGSFILKILCLKKKLDNFIISEQLSILCLAILDLKKCNYVLILLTFSYTLHIHQHLICHQSIRWNAKCNSVIVIILQMKLVQDFFPQFSIMLIFLSLRHGNDSFNHNWTFTFFSLTNLTLRHANVLELYPTHCIPM